MCLYILNCKKEIYTEFSNKIWFSKLLGSLRKFLMGSQLNKRTCKMLREISNLTWGSFINALYFYHSDSMSYIFWNRWPFSPSTKYIVYMRERERGRMCVYMLRIKWNRFFLLTQRVSFLLFLLKMEMWNFIIRNTK